MSSQQNTQTVVPGSTVLITGAARGMGELYARRAAREGAAAIALWDVDQNRVEALAAELGRRPAPGRSSAPQVRAYVVDISDRDAVADAAQRTRAELGDPD
ncbi:MAG: SDR family NAD(P)-dependent oxidoreductase, partial [Actinobacteria bacterium]|nr:SDR family NAD(P)-dependent oxidoreductase [Actinomycetota bacterium]